MVPSHVFSVFSKVSNLVESLVDQHYKVLAVVLYVFPKVSNLFESLVHQHYKVLSHVFESFESLRITSRQEL